MTDEGFLPGGVGMMGEFDLQGDANRYCIDVERLTRAVERWANRSNHKAERWCSHCGVNRRRRTS